jgi:hypothetical protein
MAKGLLDYLIKQGMIREDAKICHHITTSILDGEIIKPDILLDVLKETHGVDIRSLRLYGYLRSLEKFGLVSFYSETSGFHLTKKAINLYRQS